MTHPDETPTTYAMQVVPIQEHEHDAMCDIACGGMYLLGMIGGRYTYAMRSDMRCILVVAYSFADGTASWYLIDNRTHPTRYHRSTTAAHQDSLSAALQDALSHWQFITIE